jgi:hypothetical protein
VSVFSDEQKEYLDSTYKRKDECETEMHEAEKEHNALNTRLVLIEKQLKLIIGILGFVGAGVGTLIIGSLWNLIAK